MFPKVKLHSRSKLILIILVAGCVASYIAYKSEVANMCSIRQLDIAGDMKTYDATKNPEFCDSLNAKISKFNDDCKYTLEEIDCG